MKEYCVLNCIKNKTLFAVFPLHPRNLPHTIGRVTTGVWADRVNCEFLDMLFDMTGLRLHTRLLRLVSFRELPANDNAYTTGLRSGFWATSCKWWLLQLLIEMRILGNFLLMMFVTTADWEKDSGQLPANDDCYNCWLKWGFKTTSC